MSAAADRLSRDDDPPPAFSPRLFDPDAAPDAGADAARPTDALPGTAEKIAAMEERARRGLPLFVPGDARHGELGRDGDLLPPLRKRKKKPAAEETQPARYFVFRAGPRERWYCYGTRATVEPPEGDPRVIWRGTDYALGLRVALDANGKGVSYRGRTQTLAAWCRELGLDFECARYRLRVGWSVRATLETPSRRPGKSTSPGIGVAA